MARLLITGANGFAGPYVAAAFARRGHEVHGLRREPVVGQDASVAVWHAADLSDADGIAQVVATARPDAVIHLAAISFVAHEQASDIYISNVVGTRNLLDAVARYGSVAGPTLIASSGNIYGNRSGGAISEDCPPDPQSDYAISKVACEHLAKMFQAKTNSVVVRPFNYTGVGQSLSFIIPKIVDHARRRASRIELGNLHVARDFSDVRFFAEAMARLIDLPAPPGTTVNICSGQAYTLTEVLDMVFRITGHQMEIVVNPAFVRDNEVERLWGDPARLQAIIGPLEPTPLEETLRWMLT